MNEPPFFSVVCATFGRGEHIRPTIESALRQTMQDFELLVIGDGCEVSTERAVGAFRSRRIVWRNLPANSGSQSAPNNEGIARARGEWICYLGHDDIWSPDHLERLLRIIRANPAPDFAVNGCIYHGPPESEYFVITGMFEDADAPFRHFFPPSSIAHRREVPARIGGWRDPRSIVAPVDCDFLLRAARAGLRFASSGHIAVHKFAAGHRYLSYLRPSSAEQRAMLDLLIQGGDGGVEQAVALSKRDGLFMAMCYPDFDAYPAGQLYENNRRNKGISRPPLRPLAAGAVIAPADDPRGLDWHGLEPGTRPFRWSGPSPHPRILIPYTGDWARIELRLAEPSSLSLQGVSLAVEGRATAFALRTDADGSRALVFQAKLSRKCETVVTLHTPNMFRLDEAARPGGCRRVGLALGEIEVRPLPAQGLWARLLGRGPSASVDAPPGQM